MTIWTKAFWKDTAERVIGTMGEVALAVLTAHTVLEEINFRFLASTTLLAGIYTLIKCIVAVTVRGRHE